jgi:hypothetical protein
MEGKRAQAVDVRMMCVGAGMVLLGTLGYALGNGKGGKHKRMGKDKEE